MSSEVEDRSLLTPTSAAAERGQRRPVLLIVEDDLDTRQALAELLSLDFDILSATDGVDAVAMSRAHVPDLVLADLTMPRLGGLGLLETLHGHPRTAGVPVVFLSGQSDSRTIVDCFRQGAADFVAKPGRPDELRVRLKRVWEQASQLARLESLARTDALTGLHNFRALQGKLEEELARAARYGAPLALLLIDLDHLKALNDQQGHEAGNAALEVLAEVLRDELREVDFAARYGGDEFVALLPHQTASEAAVVAERLRIRLSRKPWALPEPLTVSIGVAGVDGQRQQADPAALLAAADAALYRCKRLGRDRVEVATPRDGAQRPRTH